MATQAQLAGSPRRIAPRDAVRLALENNLRDEMLHARLKAVWPWRRSWLASADEWASPFPFK